jgi:hypothetical protein
VNRRVCRYYHVACEGNIYAGGIKLVGLLGASITALFLSSAATAKSVEAPGAQKVERSAARKSAEPQNAASTGEVEKLAEVDSRPKNREIKPRSPPRESESWITRPGSWPRI